VYTRVSSEYAFLDANGAISSAAPTVPPTLTVSAGSAALRISLTAPADGSDVTAFAATVADPASGQTWNCFSQPRRNGAPATCTVDGLANGTTYQVTAIAGSPAGNSPVAGPVEATPIPVPVVGSILKATALRGGAVRFRVSPSDANGSPPMTTLVVCTPVAGGVARTAAADTRRAVVTGLRPVRYSCLVRSQNAVGIAESAAIRIKARR
jgi:hypothetical protein